MYQATLMYAMWGNLRNLQSKISSTEDIGESSLAWQISHMGQLYTLHFHKDLVAACSELLGRMA